MRGRFPLLTAKRERPLVYLDSAATSQKPESVLAAMDDYYRRYNANIHRGIYAIAEEATAAYEDARAAARALHRRPAARGDLHPQQHRGHQPGGLRVGALRR